MITRLPRVPILLAGERHTAPASNDGSRAPTLRRTNSFEQAKRRCVEHSANAQRHPTRTAAIRKRAETGQQRLITDVQHENGPSDAISAQTNGDPPYRKHHQRIMIRSSETGAEVTNEPSKNWAEDTLADIEKAETGQPDASTPDRDESTKRVLADDHPLWD
jgi:hypothetical protein